jgi:hypothetical protein
MNRVNTDAVDGRRHVPEAFEHGCLLIVIRV